MLLLCVWLKLFRCRFVPLFEPNPSMLAHFARSGFQSHPRLKIPRSANDGIQSHDNGIRSHRSSARSRPTCSSTRLLLAAVVCVMYRRPALLWLYSEFIADYRYLDSTPHKLPFNNEAIYCRNYIRKLSTTRYFRWMQTVGWLEQFSCKP